MSNEQEKLKEPVVDTSKLPPNEKDLPVRMKEFNKDLGILLARYELQLIALPKILPDGRTTADPMIISSRKPEKKEGEEPVTADDPAKNPPADYKNDEVKKDGGIENPEA